MKTTQNLWGYQDKVTEEVLMTTFFPTLREARQNLARVRRQNENLRVVRLEPSYNKY